MFLTYPQTKIGFPTGPSLPKLPKDDGLHKLMLDVVLALKRAETWRWWSELVEVQIPQSVLILKVFFHLFETVLKRSSKTELLWDTRLYYQNLIVDSLEIKNKK